MPKLHFIILIIFTVTFFEFTHAQENANPIQYVYINTTNNAITELEVFCKGDKKLFASIIGKIKALELDGKIILSSIEFEPIKQRIKDVSTLDINNALHKESILYATNAKHRYIVITDLLKTEE